MKVPSLIGFLAGEFCKEIAGLRAAPESPKSEGVGSQLCCHRVLEDNLLRDRLRQRELCRRN